ncbi:sigma-70 family RNA polymerase sigma factor [Phocicoccus pinnipedialis]|uniref:RNA polymerase sigma factor SigS n=1 Tax=Phocicoccus pinnipedialis TaxID=110845 RepID=A0A6V7R761_9BACL|nr:sigma-70 family RNA polymerase sigma factor [Jeotgalicoccus pinnipedialis]MBP1938950.1 DNA-directed RNA polymerase [Jeotgalicoccus pinnipedialis]CAD2073211.1 RNA polymerase sigma factor SigS [Jeotgalicoccus pinnipedialis]
MKDIKTYEPMIMSIIKKLGIKYHIDEYMQIGRITVFTAQNTFDEEKAKCTQDQYIYTRIYQRLIDTIRKESNYQKYHTTTEDTLMTTHSYRDQYDYIYFEDLKTNLNEREQYVFTYLLNGYSISEISVMLGVSNSTAKNIRKSIREKLSKV